MKFIGITLKILNLIFFTQGFLEIKDLTFVILSQENKYNLQTAKKLKVNICEQALDLSQECPPIFLSHEKFPHVGEWAILPILPKVAEIARASSWILFFEDRITIKLKYLLEVLNKYDLNKDIWIGYNLQDNIPTIIHHFREKEFNYPHLGAGIAISNPLLRSVSERISKTGESADFTIDKSFELASFIWNDGNGPLLTHDDAFCVKEDEVCATFPNPFETCGEAHVPMSSVYFAVKTCAKFHENRVPVVLTTWARYAEKVTFFSDIVDQQIPTISLGIPNTESGHCGKTMAILNFFNQKVENDTSLHWLVLVDDDTILSIMRVLELLSCYDWEDNVALGERYGYGVHNPLGFNYITGGGGMIFSRTLVRNLVDICKCPSISAPDDMVLGHCISTLRIKVTHSHLFHQARPIDYSEDFLKSDRHASFHKHWMVDPIEVYNHWFLEEDSKLSENLNIKTEL